ncbi:MAG: hypothetical protein DMG23_00275 [Acidobacteria bacterium]|nr:MAG: hypothetical protein DMG23_00275 [Acidobacteriota bacterium]
MGQLQKNSRNRRSVMRINTIAKVHQSKTAAPLGTVCLLYTHPLVLEDYQKLLSASGFRIEARQLDTSLAFDLEKLDLPVVQVFIVDTLAITEAIQLLVAEIRAGFPKSRQIVVGAKLSAESAFPLFRIGVTGLLTHDQAHRYISRAVSRVAEGGCWAPRNLLASYLGAIANKQLVKTVPNITHRERTVLELLKLNRSNREIAYDLKISESTAKFYVSKLLAKFKVQSRTDLIMLFSNLP